MTGDASAPRTADHPLIDGAGPGWVATETRAPVVALTTGMADLLHRTATAGIRTVVVTGPHSRMTQPMWHALQAVRGGWVVRTDDGFYDAAGGARLAGAADALQAPRIGDDGPHPAFLRRPLTTRLQLVVTASSRHRVSRPVLLGGSAEAVALAMTDAPPAAWGATEPLTAGWDRADLTARSQRRMPADSMWSFVGARVGASAPASLIGTIDVARTSEGLEETTRMWADVGGPASGSSAGIATRARGILSSIAGSGMPLLALAMAHIGTPDLTRGPLMPVPPEPLALLVGPPAVRASGMAPAAWADEFGAALVGSPRLPSALVALGSPAGGGWERLQTLITRLGVDRMRELLALSRPVGAQLRRDPAAGGHLDEGGSNG
ncbi:hypothetical protein IF188_10935 [Microbacterium sp. NEAU-LLC]|uniref:Uncharacterized protein n=1 Tax=Microbacterium helvum TaxID=2773713 RepID=A0ABR8NNH0_9MICO|nr:DUF6177 family protein [Microbacterium helvum]MBD3942210.1 hypothetical protein [Microbacterium helvum]